MLAFLVYVVFVILPGYVEHYPGWLALAVLFVGLVAWGFECIFG